jgi:hypothetical protein
VTPNFLNYTNQNPPSTMGNVMTLSGKELAVSLYTATTDNDQVTLVFRQNFYPSAASDTLDQAQTAAPIYASSFGWGVYMNDYNPTRMAQTFTAGQTGILDRVSVYINSDYIVGPVTVSIQTVSNGAPSGVTLGSGTILASAIPWGYPLLPPTGNPKWVSTIISPVAGNSLALTSGTQYAIVLSAGGNQITWYGSRDPYPGGSMVYDYSSGWVPSSIADAMFQTYIVPPTAPGDDYVGWRLSFVDNAGSSVP